MDPFSSSSNSVSDADILDNYGEPASLLEEQNSSQLPSSSTRGALQPHGHRHLLSPALVVDYLLNEGMFEHEGKVIEDPYAVRSAEVAWKRVLLSATNTLLPHIGVGPVSAHVQRVRSSSTGCFNLLMALTDDRGRRTDLPLASVRLQSKQYSRDSSSSSCYRL